MEKKRKTILNLVFHNNFFKNKLSLFKILKINTIIIKISKKIFHSKFIQIIQTIKLIFFPQNIFYLIQ